MWKCVRFGCIVNVYALNTDSEGKVENVIGLWDFGIPEASCYTGFIRDRLVPPVSADS